MNAHAHLLSLGWAGTGHSLDSKPYKQKGHRGLAYDPAKVGNNGNGLVKPLSVSQRQGRFGIGKKAHEPQAGNEWWLKGFESALGNFGKSESERSSGTSTPVARGNGGKHGELYSFFIKGQQMQGTLCEPDDSDRPSKKRKSDVLDERIESTLTVPKPGNEQLTAVFEQAGAFFALRDKGEKRRHRTERPNPVDEFENVGQYLKVQTEKKKKRRRKSEAVEPVIDTPSQDDEQLENQPQPEETKEQRRERRRKRREGKERRRKALQPESVPEDDMEDAAAAMNARKTERRKSKADKTASSSTRPRPF